jgi:hypothetical protein
LNRSDFRCANVMNEMGRGIIVGYARASTDGQTLDAHQAALAAAGAERVLAASAFLSVAAPPIFWQRIPAGLNAFYRHYSPKRSFRFSAAATTTSPVESRCERTRRNLDNKHYHSPKKAVP